MTRGSPAPARLEPQLRAPGVQPGPANPSRSRSTLDRGTSHRAPRLGVSNGIGFGLVATCAPCLSNIWVTERRRRSPCQATTTRCTYARPRRWTSTWGSTSPCRWPRLRVFRSPTMSGSSRTANARSGARRGRRKLRAGDANGRNAPRAACSQADANVLQTTNLGRPPAKEPHRTATADPIGAGRVRARNPDRHQLLARNAAPGRSPLPIRKGSCSI